MGSSVETGGDEMREGLEEGWLSDLTQGAGPEWKREVGAVGGLLSPYSLRKGNCLCELTGK